MGHPTASDGKGSAAYDPWVVGSFGTRLSTGLVSSVGGAASVVQSGPADYLSEQKRACQLGVTPLAGTTFTLCAFVSESTAPVEPGFRRTAPSKCIAR